MHTTHQHLFHFAASGPYTATNGYKGRALLARASSYLLDADPGMNKVHQGDKLARGRCTANIDTPGSAKQNIAPRSSFGMRDEGAAHITTWELERMSRRDDKSMCSGDGSRGTALIALTTITVLASALWPALAAAANLVDLGPVTAKRGAIDNQGHVLLDSGVYSNGVVTPLPALPGATSPAVPVAINANGDIAGYSVDANGHGVAVLYSKGVLTDLGNPLAPTQPTTSVFDGGAVSINNSGQVVGHSQTGESPYEGEWWLWSNGAVQAIKSGSPCCWRDYVATGINDKGQIVGYGSGGVNPPAGWVYDSKAQTWSGQILQGGIAEAVNASGQVAGSWGPLGAQAPYGSFTSHATIYDIATGTTSDIGALARGDDAGAIAINAANVVVGTSNFEAKGTSFHAFVYNGAMLDLNKLMDAADPLYPYVTLVRGVGINDNNLVLATGMDSRDMKTHSYLMQLSSAQLVPSPPHSGGGGSFDLLSLIALASLVAVSQYRSDPVIPCDRRQR
jgi:probable HAF family extracellular repeat protein